jgi:hypothetical protein
MDKADSYCFARWLLAELEKRGISRSDLAVRAGISRGAAYGYTAVAVPSAILPDETMIPRLLRAVGLDPADSAGWDAWRDARRALALSANPAEVSP